MTNAQLITRLREATSDTETTRPERGDDTLAGILTDSQELINNMMELCRKEFELELVADQAEYDVDADFCAFVKDRLRQRGGCVYWDGGNLTPTTPAALDKRVAGWRGADSGTPSEFYLETGDNDTDSLTKLGLYRPPSADFIADVPILTYYGVKRPAAIVSGSRLPFDNNPIFKPAHRLIVLHGVWSLDLEDGRIGNADAREARWRAFLAEVDQTMDMIPGRIKGQGAFSFDKDWRP